MNSVLITGSSGFLGRIFKTFLQQEGVIIYEPGIDGNRTDITQPFKLADEKIDTVLHVAGKAHSFPKNATDVKQFYDVNFGGTVNLCAAIDKLPVKPNSFIFISTVAVYGVDNGTMITEQHPLHGESPYAKSKIKAEEYLTNWAAKKNIVLGILRLPLIAGQNPPGNLGAMISGIKRGRYLSIGNASAQKSMVWAPDVARILSTIAKIGGTYNLTDSYHPSFSEVEYAISQSLNRLRPKRIPVFIAQIIGKVGDIIGEKFPINTGKLKKILATLTFDDTKAKEQLGWKPTPVLEKIDEII